MDYVYSGISFLAIFIPLNSSNSIDNLFLRLKYSSKDQRLKQFSREELLNNIYSIDIKGKIRNGIDTYFKVFQFIPFFFVLLIFRLPVLYFISKKIYQFVVSNREIERCTIANCTIPNVTQNQIDRSGLKIFKNLYVRDFRKFLFGLLAVLFFILQVNSSLKSLGVINKNMLHSLSHVILGITRHGVFLDDHYIDFSEIYTLSYNGELLPLFKYNGMPDTYQKSGVWANFNFRVNGPKTTLGSKKLHKGLNRHCSFFLGKNNLSFDNQNFKIHKKRVDFHFAWEKDLLEKKLITPWIEVANFTFHRGVYKVELIND